MEDANSFYRLNLSHKVLKYTGDTPFNNIAEAKRFLEKYDQFQKYGVGRMAVIEKSSKEFIGWCGLKFDPTCSEYDLGFRFFEAYWNRGFATETAKKCLAYGFEQLQIQRIVGRARSENKASIHVLEKCGMTFNQILHLDGHETYIFEQLKTDYENLL